MSRVFRKNFFKQISNFSKDNLFCDVTLISSDDECKITAHKMILAATSKYFYAMFSGSSRESTEKEVKIQIDSKSLKLIINYIYTGCIELSTDSVVEVLQNVNFFELEALINECCDLMARNLNISNCLETARIADVYNLIKLYEKSENFICDKFEEIRKVNNDAFLNLDCETLNKLISSNKLQLESEEEVFNCIKSWVDHDQDNRTIYYDTLLHNVRLPLIDPVFITNVIQKACESTECKMLINKTLQWHLLPELRPVLFSEKLTQPRYPKHTLLAISGWASEDNLDVLSVGEFNFKLKKWSYATWPAPPKKLRHCFAIFEYALFNDCLFLAGGYNINKIPTNNVIFFDLKTKIWKETHKMNRMRTNFGFAATENFLWAYGGEEMGGSPCIEKMSQNSAWEIIQDRNTSPEASGSNSSIPQPLDKFDTLTKNKLICLPSNIGTNFLYTTPNGIQYACLKKSVYSSRSLGIGKVRSKEKELLIEVSTNSIFKYDLQSGAKHEIPTNKIGEDFKSCKMFDHYVVIFGDTKFQIYYPFIDHWITLPDLDNTHGRVVLIRQ